MLLHAGSCISGYRFKRSSHIREIGIRTMMRTCYLPPDLVYHYISLAILASLVWGVGWEDIVFVWSLVLILTFTANYNSLLASAVQQKVYKSMNRDTSWSKSPLPEWSEATVALTLGVCCISGGFYIHILQIVPLSLVVDFCHSRRVKACSDPSSSRA